MVESLSSDGIGLDRSSTEVVTLEVGQNIMLTGNNVELLNTHRSSNSPDVVLWTTSSGEQVSTFQTSNGTAGSSPTTPSSSFSLNKLMHSLFILNMTALHQSHKHPPLSQLCFKQAKL